MTHPTNTGTPYPDPRVTEFSEIRLYRIQKISPVHIFLKESLNFRIYWHAHGSGNWKKVKLCNSTS